MSDPSKLPLNQKIMTWAKGRVGKPVGRGTCWDLGEEALKKAGAKTSNDLGPVGDDTDYVWGEELANVKDVRRGDILQIRDHLVTTTTVTTTTFGDGSTITETGERTARRGHHTAIARSSADPDGVIKTYEQHVNGRDTVQELRLPTRDIGAKTTHKVGKTKHPKSGKLETVKIESTVTVKVTGTIWMYRPQAK
jgi:hypothetical protein